MNSMAVSGIGGFDPARLFNLSGLNPNGPFAGSHRMDVHGDRNQQRPSLLERFDTLDIKGLGPVTEGVITLEAIDADVTIEGEGFEAAGFHREMNFNATLKGENFMFELNIEVTHSAFGVAIGSGFGLGSPEEEEASSEEDTGEEASGSKSLMEQALALLPEHVRDDVRQFISTDGVFNPANYTPEASANRIADFALSGFSFFDGGRAAAENSQASRQEFADFIIPAIDRGFREARDILGEVHQIVSDNIQLTRDLIDARFNEFILGEQANPEAEADEKKPNLPAQAAQQALDLVA